MSATPCAPGMDASVSVIVPTFREAANLPLVVPRIVAAMDGAGLRGEVLIVDDDSSDGTVEICERLGRGYPVRLIVRHRKRGLASATIRGMQEARGDVFVVLDADLSHPPEKIPELVQSLSDPGVDLALGSRYVAGGDIEEGWGWYRKLNSRIAKLLARPLTTCSDPMAGFFAVRRATFEAAQPLAPVGYKICLELIVKGHCRNIREVPIRFAKRRHGKSKLNLREQFNYLWHLERLYSFRLGAYAKSS